MASQTQTESLVIELATESFKAFCDDIAGMFGIGMECEQKEVRTETVAGLKKCFKKLVAVNVVETTGVLEGTFQLIFDQEGLFTLGGVIVMLPEQKILANRKDPSPQLATSMVDAVGEAGNLLVGSWDRVFREGLTRHGHFLQKLPAFIGKPWDDPLNKIGLSADGELIYIPYEMTVSSYPAFNCGVIFPKALFVEHPEALNKPDAEPAAEPSTGSVPEDTKPEAQTPQNVQTSPAKTDSKESDSSNKSGTPQDSDNKESKQKSPEAEKAPAGETAVEGKSKAEQPAAVPEDTTKKSKSKQSSDKNTPPKETEAKENTPDTPAKETVEAQAQAGKTAEPESAGDVADQKPAMVNTEAVSNTTPSDASGETQVVEPIAGQDAAQPQENPEPAAGKVSEAIRKMTQSTAPLPIEFDESISAVNQSPSLAVEDKSQSHQPARRRRGDVGLNKFLSISAKDVMQSGIVWANPEETVQQALTKMQQYDTGYVMVGVDGVLEGIVSRSDITGALSPYLRSIFSKWRRPLDDATLKIKIKWIMSRPVRTVKPQTPLATIMENVCRYGGSGLPVVDEQGKVQGLVTTFNIFQKMLCSYADVPTVGRAPQTPPLT